MLLYLNSKQDALELYDDEPLILLDSVSLTSIEFNVLKVLYDNSYDPCTRQQLNLAGWPNRVVGPNSLNVYIMHLRKKLKSLVPESEIRVVPSHGYKLQIPTSIQLVGEDQRPNMNLRESPKQRKVSYINEIGSPSKRTKVKRKQTQPSHSTCEHNKRHIRWGDLILTVCIWAYTVALYHSIYN
ncbi:helix-turn-helix domain-containing protein [Vibrio aestuarianus]|uniref:winged helix-turn-helix domain-containing protein n=1 Tax=Vibrio aestuarianus TaxID=28171 RepID=UPI00155932F6|nr:helix-turn-helix domain-containing protein [Vibrio aestuarianus]NGZ12979.1 helix-turn-helix domain-containing protein [Vibrio aestuarianus]NKZ49127.1 helix-turn-helix domain-containing protein [Vibrio aestuarianus]